MGYTRQEIIKRCEDEMANPSTFYKAPFINYHGKTTDTNELCTTILHITARKDTESFLKQIIMQFL